MNDTELERYERIYTSWDEREQAIQQLIAEVRRLNEENARLREEIERQEERLVNQKEILLRHIESERQALSEVERLTAENARMREWNNKLVSLNLNFSQENKMLMAALENLSKRDNYYYNGSELIFIDPETGDYMDVEHYAKKILKGGNS